MKYKNKKIILDENLFIVCGGVENVVSILKTRNFRIKIVSDQKNAKKSVTI